MFVLEEYLRLGVGAKLFEASLQWCRSNGINRMRVVASAQNKRAIDFYKKNGFDDY